MSERRFRALSECWPSPDELIAALTEAGFVVDEARFSFLSRLSTLPAARAWPAIRTPRSAQVSDPKQGSFTFLTREGPLPSSQEWSFAFVDARRSFETEPQFPVLAVSHPDAAMDFVLRHIVDPDWFGPSEPLPSHVIAEGSVHIGPATIIGAGTLLEHGVRIGRDVVIGKNCRIGAGSRIADGTHIGDHCTLIGAVSIGGPGFGFVEYPGKGRRELRCHVGRVAIGNQVRLGSFVSIDRGVFEDTLIGDGSSLDNLIQIGHNSTLGRDTVVCGLVGIAGSTEIGDRVTIAGLVGTKGHVRIGNDVTIAAQSGVNCDIEEGQTVKGYPPRSLPEALKLQVLIGRLPEFFQRLRKLEDKKT